MSCRTGRIQALATSVPLSPWKIGPAVTVVKLRPRRRRAGSGTWRMPGRFYAHLHPLMRRRVPHGRRYTGPGAPAILERRRSSRKRGLRDTGREAADSVECEPFPTRGEGRAPVCTNSLERPRFPRDQRMSHEELRNRDVCRGEDQRVPIAARLGTDERCVNRV